ncbi:response regulator [Candidatus Poribacteria bacterium]|nr:response regulator [Candidatus Poribacteria bacterium]
MKKRVLFIEDEKFFLEQLQIALKDYDITPAYSAPSGIELIKKKEFDIVLLDIMMPPPLDIDPEVVDFGRSTGVEVCKRIKSIKPEIPVIVLTVVRDPSILEKITEAGASKIINKPASSKVVSTNISELLNQAPAS